MAVLSAIFTVDTSSIAGVQLEEVLARGGRPTGTKFRHQVRWCISELVEYLFAFVDTYYLVRVHRTAYTRSGMTTASYRE